MRPFDAIPQTASTPRVSLDPDGRTLLIAGESYPENSFTFYAPIIQWARETLASGEDFRLDVSISYMNSSSTKCMLDLLDLLQEAHEREIPVSITWRYDSDNPRSLDLAEEFREEVTFPFTIVESQE